MTLVLRCRFDDTDLTIDSSDDPKSITNGGGAVSAIDATYGNVASFSSASNGYLVLDASLTTMQGNASRTLSYWMKRNATTSFNVVHSSGNGDFSSAVMTKWRSAFLNTGFLEFFVGGAQTVPSTSSLSADTWYHVVETYDGTDISMYFDGAINASATIVLDTASDPLSIGGDIVDVVDFKFSGFMSDFRVYDDALSGVEIADLHANGPNPPELNVTMYTHVADLMWGDVPGASSYSVTSKQDGGVEAVLAETSDTSHELFDSTPGSVYEFNIYTDTTPLTATFTSTKTAPSVDAASTVLLLDRLGNDLTMLNETSLQDVDPLLSSVLSTGDEVNTSIGSTVFVENSDTFTLNHPGDIILTPFQQSSGSGQTISIVSTDLSSNTIGFDEASNEVVFSSTNYDVGDSFVVGSLKAVVREI